jgi:hypothetical protein
MFVTIQFLSTVKNVKIKIYRDIMPESRNSPLLDNGCLTRVLMEMQIRGDRLGTERAFHVNGINKGSMDTR